jgi:hypothetical protein
MRAVVAMVVVAWALWRAVRGPSKADGLPRSKREGPRRTCPACYCRNTSVVVLDVEQVTGKPGGTAVHCWDCDNTFDYKWWD